MKRAVSIGILIMLVCVLPLMAAVTVSVALGHTSPKPGVAGMAGQAQHDAPLVEGGGPYTLIRVVVPSGGPAAGGVYRLGGSIAQAEAGPPQRGGGYVLNGGFVNAPGAGARRVYLPHVVR